MLDFLQGRFFKFAALAAFVASPLVFFSSGVATAGRAGGDSAQSFLANQSASSGPGDRLVDPGTVPTPDKGNIRGSLSRSSRAVCVRLCDGSFFPLSAANGDNEASCARQCPGAPTKAFYLAAGSDKIDDAASGDGQRYTALPTAFHYRLAVEHTCACKSQGGPSNAAALLDDPTLRKGDLVMTPDGVRVFRGSSRLRAGADDFISITQSSLPRAERDELMAIERVSAHGDTAATSAVMSK
jgi:Protein of unknown function (DUF2865)